MQLNHLRIQTCISYDFWQKLPPTLMIVEQTHKIRPTAQQEQQQQDKMAPTENPQDKMDALYPDQEAIPVKCHVLAPATLPAGYTFQASVNGDLQRTFTAEVVRALNSVLMR